MFYWSFHRLVKFWTNLGLNCLSMLGRVVTVCQLPVCPIAKETPLHLTQLEIFCMTSHTLQYLYCSRVLKKLGARAPVEPITLSPEIFLSFRAPIILEWPKPDVSVRVLSLDNDKMVRVESHFESKPKEIDVKDSPINQPINQSKTHQGRPQCWCPRAAAHSH